MKKVNFDEFKEVFYNQTSDSDMFELWNKVCENNRFESTIYNMEDLDEILGNMSPTDLLSRLDSNFRINDDYFYYDGCGILHSVDSAWDFFTNGSGDVNGVFRYLSDNDDEMGEFMEENDPDFYESEWEDEDEE